MDDCNNNLQEKEGYLLLQLRVQPKASKNKILLDDHWGYRVYLTAPPVDGEANEALRSFICKKLGIPRQCVSLVNGEKSRTKTIRIEGISKSLAITRLSD